MEKVDIESLIEEKIGPMKEKLEELENVTSAALMGITERIEHINKLIAKISVDLISIQNR